MPIRISMPICHDANGGPNYSAFYSIGVCSFHVDAYFNQGTPRCDGIRIAWDGPLVVATDVCNLFALTDGFVSFGDNALVLRLPRELGKSRPASNSGSLFGSVRPQGPQLRHVAYRFAATPDDESVRDRIGVLLDDATHPMRTVSHVGTQTLGAYLAAAPGNRDLVLDGFMAGTSELFVQAGDVIANFWEQTIELRFHDSCGSPLNERGKPNGRPLSPAYFLSLLRLSGNGTNVTMLTPLFAMVPAPPDTTHPLYHLLEPARLTAASVDTQFAVDLTSTLPARPLHVHVDVTDASNNVVPNMIGIPMRGLGDWHQSRNAASLTTSSPVEWRLRGNHPTVATNYPTADGAADIGRMITRRAPAQTNDSRLPGGAAFDHTLAPNAAPHVANVAEYWNRYGKIFNAVADVFELPVELLVAVACAETSTHFSYDTVFANTHEMDVIRMEPLDGVPATLSTVPATQTLLSTYSTLAGTNGANANIPVPWNGAGTVRTNTTLTWAQLAQLVQSFPAAVKVSPGVMQVLVDTANSDLKWAGKFYGDGFVSTIRITTANASGTSVELFADNPAPLLATPGGRDDLFSDWFGVSCDASGANTTTAANVDATLTKMKRAMHCIIAGASHLKWAYNTTIGTSNNRVCDFDLPTAFSGYNDGAKGVTPATAASPADDKWKLLFALKFYDKNYPKDSPRYYNAAVAMFNAGNATPPPTVRLWSGT